MNILRYNLGFLIIFNSEAQTHTCWQKDKKFKVHWENIAPTKKWNFQILGDGDWENTGSPYDFLSVMHYSSANFAAGSKPTMTRRDNGEAVRAQRNRPSTLDISQVCHIYGCPEHCGHEMRKCKNGQEVFKHRFCDGIIDCEGTSTRVDHERILNRRLCSCFNRGMF